jgi:hypothetical protein
MRSKSEQQVACTPQCLPKIQLQVWQPAKYMPGVLSLLSGAAVSWLWTIAQAQIHNRLLALFNSLYVYATPDYPNVVEINVTGGSRYFFTREPEHIKTVLTTKFAEYGKGPEFHRVWVSSPR